MDMCDRPALQSHNKGTTMKAIFEADLHVQMRDGVSLATSVWRPAGEGKVPAVLMRSPYQKDDLKLGVLMLPGPIALLRAGYAVVAQDVRGTYRSEEAFVPHAADLFDGEDTIRWLAEQPWCDGNVGMYGPSYLGLVQWQAAVADTPALKAIVPMVTCADIYSLWYSRGGALSLQTLLTWCTIMAMNAAMRALPQGGAELADIQQLAAILENPDHLYLSPVRDQPLLTKYLPWLDDVMAHPMRDDFWKALSVVDRAEQVTTPALSIVGWYDLYATQQLRDHQELTQRAGSVQARNGQRLLIGPWSHMIHGQFGAFGDRDFGTHANAMALGFDEAHVNFFDRWLKGREDALEGIAPVRLFVMGINQWRDEQAWPLPDTNYVDYFLGGVGPANTASGAGLLTKDRFTHDMVDRYLYDPLRPVPTVGGDTLDMRNDGPRDQALVETREDVLCFTTAVLDEPVEVTGPVTLKLFVSSSARDTDFTAKLVDVYPDGRAIILCHGILRMRYRRSRDACDLMKPNETYEIDVDVGATSNVFLPGHRIRLEVSSSNYPRFDRNSNTGGDINSESVEDMVVALNQVHRGPAHSSRLILPIIPCTRSHR